MVRFATTDWSAVARAGSSREALAQDALERLCASYWYPVYALIRRYGHRAAEAEDLTQAYFARFLEKGWVRQLRPERGRFRSFLLVSVRNFLHNERESRSAQKRGGGARPLSLDALSAEQRFAVEPAEMETPESVFERAWAEVVLARALDRLREEAAAAGGLERFERLESHLTDLQPCESLRQVAESWGIGESSVRSALHRLRKRLGGLLRDEIAATVADPSDVTDELRCLLAAVGR